MPLSTNRAASRAAAFGCGAVCTGRRGTAASFITQRLGRVDPARPPARVQRRDERERERDQRDGHDVARQRLARHAADEVHARRQEGDAEHAFDRGHDDADVEGDEQPEDDAAQGADDAGGRPLHDEDAHDRSRARAQRAQDRDVGALVGDGHHQRRHQIERRDRDDQRQDDEHQPLLDLHRVEPVAVGSRPVAHQQPGAEPARERIGHLARRVQVAQPQLHAGRAVDAEEALGVADVDQRQPGVVFVVPDLEDARERGVAQLGRERGHRRLLRGRDAANDRGVHLVAARHQRLRRHEGRGADHFRVLPRLRRDAAPIGQRATAGVHDLDVRDHRQHAVAHLLLEAVHHAEHDDQRRHAEPDAEHRHAGDEGDEAVAPAAAPGPRVAPADLQFVGQAHRAGDATRGRRSVPRSWASPRRPGAAADNRRMHLLVPFAAGVSDAGAQALHELHLPRLERLLAVLETGPGIGSDEYSLNPPHEQVLALARGWDAPDGRLPFAALLARADGLDPDAADDAGWGLLTPSHWQVGREQIVLRDPAELGLGEAESRALFDAVRPLFDSEGWALSWGAPLRWYARHGSLAGLATASLERVIGRNLDLWLPDRRAGAQVRRLQSEVQMLLHTHPINDAREARGELTVNSFWLSGTGRAPPPSAADVQVDDRLRAPMLAEAWDDWADAWQALDAGPIADLLARAIRREPVSMTLAGERSARRYDSMPRPPWQRLARRWRHVAAAAVLESL